MVQSKKFRGVRQRHWGSWVSEIRHPLLNSILSEKLRKCCKMPSPSLTCLRLDTENSHIGVWQKRAGPRSDSSWVMTVELGRKTINEAEKSSDGKKVGVSGESGGIKSMGQEVGENLNHHGLDEEQKAALQMIEELLNRN
ncbi:hypothetical protein COLO4_12947 [Corchorus olitorius]|uniref:AP2/ERF domain-containing protein n=1 Tax=Corchorus olitorius TaxID=93759 RepID=A0A1R3JYX3_9ROSI|nr:hypothetical protein COLO4_12947 [Corchorus olitorius]